jgi:hypothetical protein
MFAEVVRSKRLVYDSLSRKAKGVLNRFLILALVVVDYS